MEAALQPTRDLFNLSSVAHLRNEHCKLVSAKPRQPETHSFTP
jgi:hypothetical protein